MKNKRAVIQFLMILFSVILLAFSGCGKKGPPLPPEIKGQKIAAPFDLKYTLGDKEIILSWNHKIDTETAVVKPEGFEIFMAKKTFKACVGCPFEFKKTGVVSMPSMEFTTRIEKGFKYYFRVQATGNDDMRSEYSKTVQFEYK
ncbi:MAG: lipoprotein [Desulfobacterales bacterium]|nr:lipoprotein [Desulfobacterales bacterium]